MKFPMNGTLFALSHALDYVESEVLGVTTHHAKRVAYLCVRMGKARGFTQQALCALAGAAVMHDNALTEYIAVRRAAGDTAVQGVAALGPHCEMGKQNMRAFPFYHEIESVVLLHHENADGSGPFQKTAAQTPLFARMIHLADQIDNAFSLGGLSAKGYEQLLVWLAARRESLFDAEVTDLFLVAFPWEQVQRLKGAAITALLAESLPEYLPDYEEQAVLSLAAVFARIVDYKSHFTSTHSLGIAEKAAAMGEFYGESSTVCTKLYLAGALHDIGKLTIPNAILEKPGPLTTEEFLHMKQHALASYEILEPLHGLADVVSWACMHHEKLDGSGYPFGKCAVELGRNERLLCCLDIYQALVETRPYKIGLPHAEAISILRSMANAGKIDSAITEDIARRFDARASAPD